MWKYKVILFERNNTASPKFIILYDYSDKNITQIEMHNTLSVCLNFFLKESRKIYSMVKYNSINTVLIFIVFLNYIFTSVGK